LALLRDALKTALILLQANNLAGSSTQCVLELLLFPRTSGRQRGQLFAKRNHVATRFSSAPFVFATWLAVVLPSKGPKLRCDDTRTYPAYDRFPRSIAHSGIRIITDIVTKKREDKQDIDSKISEGMSLMGKRSAAAREKAWGKAEFKKRMREYGKRGGRPKKSKTT
jgi:hypothetical protein